MKVQISKLFFVPQIKKRIEETCKGEFETHFVAALLDWLKTEMCGWLQFIFQEAGQSPFGLAFNSSLKSDVYDGPDSRCSEAGRAELGPPVDCKV